MAESGSWPYSFFRTQFCKCSSEFLQWFVMLLSSKKLASQILLGPILLGPLPHFPPSCKSWGSLFRFEIFMISLFWVQQVLPLWCIPEGFPHASIFLPISSCFATKQTDFTILKIPKPHIWSDYFRIAKNKVYFSLFLEWSFYSSFNLFVADI